MGDFIVLYDIAPDTRILFQKHVQHRAGGNRGGGGAGAGGPLTPPDFSKFNKVEV